MKFARPVQLLLVGVLSGVCGYGLGLPGNEPKRAAADRSGGGDGSGGYSQSRRTGNPPGSPENLLTPGMRELLGANPLSESSIRGVTTRILSESDPVRRFAAIALIIDSMTPATASSIRQGFLDSTINTGRRNDDAWFMMVRKYGETLGQAACDEVKGKGNGLEESLALEGWAMSDSGGAFAHLRKMDQAAPEFADNCAALLTGIAKIDPEKSFQLILNDPDLSVNPMTLMASAVQSQGMDGVTQSLQNALDRSGPEAAQSPAFRGMFEFLANDMMHQSWTSGRSEKVLPWLEQQKGQPFLTDQIASHATMDVALQGKVAESLDWVDRMNDGDAGGALGRNGLRSAFMRDPSLLANVDEATLGRVIAQFPPNSPAMTILADAIAPLKPAYANRLRAAGP